MDGLPKHPVIYEINTWVWLGELTGRHGHSITLANIPDAEWDSVSGLRPDAVWLMGVWERSPAGTAIAMTDRALQEDFQRALPDLEPGDIVGSPYCVRRYAADPALGGREGLATARQALADRGIGLVLDFVPNHTAPDNPWVTENPDFYLHGTEEELRREPGSFGLVNGNVFARGKDPFFPAWQDVLQINACNPALRKAVIGVLTDIASQCDGVRCDMAMLVMNRIFKQTWGDRAATSPDTDYWPEVITGVHQDNPDFRFLAEAYWDLEWELQQQGFDYCYDKRLYDRLVNDNAESVRLHLHADLAYQNGLVRFIENHDEPRAAATFPPAKLRAAAVATCTLPGALLIHEGQLEGRTVRLPVFLARRPEEEPDETLKEFYLRLLRDVADKEIKKGEWRLCEVTGWPDNDSCRNLAAWSWVNGEARHAVVVNLSDSQSQGRVHLPWDGLAENRWRMEDLFSEAAYRRSGAELANEGLFVNLDPWGFHYFEATAEPVHEVRPALA